MSPITFDEAYAATNPEDSEEARTTAAGNIIAGVAANDAYWDSRSRLEALEARATGHGEVTRAEGEAPTAVGTGTGTPETVEGSATEEPATALTPGATETGGDTAPPSPDNPNQAIATLRAQVAKLGGSPEA